MIRKLPYERDRETMEGKKNLDNNPYWNKFGISVAPNPINVEVFHL
jgi:hypothetical protein